MSELKPCPFCGGEVYVLNADAKYCNPKIRCEECDGEFSLDYYASTVDDLIAVWNRRTNDESTND